jgi:hypothetical protein
VAERLVANEKVEGSNPFSRSTNNPPLADIYLSHAAVAELADAQRSGRCGFKSRESSNLSCGTNNSNPEKKRW